MSRFICPMLLLMTLMALACQPSTASAAGTAGAEATQAAEAAAIDVMERFLAAFNARDAAAWADTLAFPHVRIASGGVVVYETPADFVAAMDLDAFAARSGWRRSSWDDLTIIQSSPDKVHLRVRFSRFDANDELLASYDSLYVIVRGQNRWGVRARSSFAP